LRLRNGGSIGPLTLKHIWATAAASSDVTVSRQESRPGAVQSPNVYVMSGSARTADLGAVEMRLRNLLQQSLPTSHIELTRVL
jgi:hypothetical protein